MKKSIIISAITCMSAAFFIQKASCQTFENLVVVNKRSTVTEQAYTTPVVIHKDYVNDISTKAMRGFLRNYKNAINVNWRKVSDGGYIAEFTIDSVQTKVAYNNLGYWTYTLKKYPENKMSSDLRSMIKRIYFDYNITDITEIELPLQGESIIYKVLIKYADNFKILRICNNEIEVTGDYTNP